MSKKSVKEQVQEQHKEFAGEVDRCTPQQLNDRIVAMQKALEESEAHKEANQALIDARAQVNELVGPYRDVKKAVSLKTKYIIELLKEREDNSPKVPQRPAE